MHGSICGKGLRISCRKYAVTNNEEKTDTAELNAVSVFLCFYCAEKAEMGTEQRWERTEI